MKGFFILINSILFSHLAYASAGAGAHGSEHGGVPTVVWYQAINVAIIFLGGIYLGRQKIVGFFLHKRNQFLQDQEKAQGFLRQAEAEHQEIKARLEKLKATRADSLLKAKTDANDMKHQMVKEAQELSKKLKAEAQLSAKLEVEKTKHHLKEQLVREAFELSKKDLSAKATSDDQKKLQEDFISKVQVVQ